MEEALSFYLGQVFATSSGFQWIVDEDAFTSGAFDIGVRRGHCTFMVSRPRDLAALPGNKRRQSLWREYKQYSGLG